MKIDAEKGEGIELAKRYGVRGFPTILLVDKEGEEIDRIVGFRPPEKFYTEVDRIEKGPSLKSLKESISRNQDDLEACLALGKKYVERDDFEKAEALFNKILADGKASPILRIQAEGQLAIAAFTKSRGKEVAALEKFFEAHAAGSEAVDHARHLHYHYQRKKDFDKAIQTGEYLIQHGPEKEQAEFFNNFAWFLATNGMEVKKALRLARKAVELSPKSAHIIDTLAEALFRNGLYKEAVETQKQAVALASEQQKKQFEERLQGFEKELNEKGRRREKF